MTTLRLYLSAQTPHSGTSGMPTTKISALNSPTNASRSVVRHAHLAQVGRQQREDLADAEALDHRGDPEDATRMRQSWAGRVGTGGSTGAVVDAGVGHRGSLADAALTRPRVRRTHESARRNWWIHRSTGPRAPNKSGVPGRRRVPRSPALRPSNLVPGTVPRIAPLTGLAVRTCPFGQDEMYGPGGENHNGLIHELASRPARMLSPKFAALWTSCG